MISSMSQSLFYWITYSYFTNISVTCACSYCLNPYFIGLPILIMNNNNNNVEKIVYIKLINSLFNTTEKSVVLNK